MLKKSELIVDVFAGGGGASSGIERALGRRVDIAINHDAHAIEMHKINHPRTKHLLECVWNKSPRDVLPAGKKVGLLWASPDCKHFSRAKGSKPVEKKIRSLAWVIIKWAAQCSPRVIIMENVREFADWGPLLPQQHCLACGWKGTEGQTLLGRGGRRKCPECDSVRLRVTEEHVPDPARKGLTFRRFVGRLKGLGYKVEWRTLNAADFGAPTHRRRLFLVARNDGEPICWPEPTHGDPKKIAAGERSLFGPQLVPWRTAAECIDWSIPCHSIFLSREEGRAVGVNRPLAEKTLRRIAMGIKRYVLDNPKPFIVNLTHQGERKNPDIDEPLPTVTGANRGEMALVTPFVAAAEKQYSNVCETEGGDFTRTSNAKRKCRVCGKIPELVVPFVAGVGGRAGETPPTAGDAPLGTVTAKNDRAIIAPTLIRFRGDADTPAANITAPSPTITAGCEANGKPGTGHGLGVVAPVLARLGQTGGNGAYANSANEPATTITSKAEHLLVAPVLVGAGGPDYAAKPREVDRPAGTLTAHSRQALVTAFIQQLAAGYENRTNDSSRDMDAPIGTVHAGGNNHGIVAASLLKHYGGVAGQEIDKPASTVTAKDHHSILAANIVSMNQGGKQWFAADDPLPTVTSGSNHAALVYSFLVKYFGSAIGTMVDSPLPTATSKDRFGLVTVTIDGQLYVIVDIGMRMLTPRELARCQGFDESYQLSGTKSQQVARIGNSVSPPCAEAVVRANCAATAATAATAKPQGAPKCE